MKGKWKNNLCIEERISDRITENRRILEKQSGKWEIRILSGKDEKALKCGSQLKKIANEEKIVNKNWCGQRVPQVI